MDFFLVFLLAFVTNEATIIIYSINKPFLVKIMSCHICLRQGVPQLLNVNANKSIKAISKENSIFSAKTARLPCVSYQI